GLDRSARIRGDQQSLASAAIGHGAAEASQQRSRQRPSQSADLKFRCHRSHGRTRRDVVGVAGVALGIARGLRGCGAALGFGARCGGAQLGEQLLEALRVAPQGLLAFAPVLVLLLQLHEQRGPRLAVQFELAELLALLFARPVQFVLAGDDGRFKGVDFLQLRTQFGNAAGPIALHVALIGQHPAGIGDTILRQQRLQRRGLALRVGGAQQARQVLAARAQRRLQGGALPLQLGQCLLVAHQAGFGFAQHAVGVTDLFVGSAQLPAHVTALAFDLAAFGGDLLEFALDGFQLALGLAPALHRCILRDGGHGERRQQQREGDGGNACAHPASVLSACAALAKVSSMSRLAPVISAGLGKSSRSRMVGATSRSAPPLRSVAMRGPAYTNGTGPTVCEVCGWPVSGSRIISTLPWSAVSNKAPPTSCTAAAISPMATSTASAAWIAAARMPLWPTISGLAMLQTATSISPERIAATSLAVTSGQLISGCRS